MDTAIALPPFPLDDMNRQDYAAFLQEHRLSEAYVRMASEIEADQVPMPDGFDSLTVAPSQIEGMGLFATRDIDRGAVICPARIGLFRTPAGRFANHAAVPSAMFIPAGDDVLMVATHKIGEGEEITVNYRHALAVNAAMRERLLGTDDAMVPDCFPLSSLPDAPDVAVEKITRLAQTLDAMGGIDDLPLDHWFPKGMYARQVHIPADTVATTLVHKTEHMTVLTRGDVTIYAVDGTTQRHRAPMVMMTQPGTMRAIYAHEDSAILTVHPCEAREPDAAKAEVMELAMTPGEYRQIVDKLKLEVLCLD